MQFKIQYLILMFSIALSYKAKGQLGTPILPNQISGMVGYWDFENNANLFQSSAGLGANLVLGGTSGSITQTAGPGTGDMAITKTTGKYLICNHGIAANGASTTFVNQYSLVIDFKMPAVNNWRTFYQTNFGNGNDGDCFMNTTGKIGVAAIGYSASTILVNEWYRLVMTVDCGNSIKYYIDGQEWVPGNGDVLNGRFSLELNGFLLFADDNAEDGNMDIAKVVLFDRYLNSNEVFDLGGYGHNPNAVSGSTAMLPYLQTPTENSIYISWHSTNASNTIVKYGTDSANLNLTASGNSQLINGNASYRWHTVQLTGLLPNTEYFYKCYSGTDSTNVAIPFKTTALLSTPNQHFRFIVLGDNRTDIAMASSLAINIRAKLVQLYGYDFHKDVNLICSVGDIVTNGSDVTQYASEYFTPFAPLTKNIPSMISIGNHENNSTMFYDYMKYHDLTDGYAAPHPYNEKFYQFSLGSSQFLFLNANTLYRIAPQTTWVNDRLNESENNPAIDFVFSFTHQPGHSEVWPDGNENYVQTSLFDALKQHHKSAMHFDGHSHNYERGVIEMVNPDSTQQHDMRQMLSGGAGSALDRWGMYPNQLNYPEINKSLDIYCWSLIDIDIDNKSYTCETFSFGNTSNPQNNVKVDSFYRKINQPGPLKAMAAGVVNSNQLVAFPMQGVDSAMTCHFQITATLGDYSNPIVQRKQDIYDYYGDSGAPNWNPIDLNANLDIKRYNIQVADGLTNGNTYGFRVRYRDNNLEWGKWSNEKTFVYSTSSPSALVDFVADSLNVPVGYTVSFSDLSGATATAWQWDFNNDGTFDSNLKDPFYQYNLPGDYTVVLNINGGGAGNIITKTNYIHVGSLVGLNEKPKDKVSLTVFPNPMKSNTKINYNLLIEQNILVEITDVNGKIINTLVNKKQQKGAHSIVWEGRSNTGELMPSGTYIVSLKSIGINESKTLIIEK
jgi:PKD repeat protein